MRDQNRIHYFGYVPEISKKTRKSLNAALDTIKPILKNKNK